MEEQKSTHKTEVVKIESIRKHPNADKLEIIDIFGFTCVVGKDQFKHGDLVAYIQPDSVVPLPDSGFENAEQFLFLNKGEAIENFKLSRRRITTCKLRGVYSQGLIVPAPKGLKIGDDASEVLGITHYEPPENDIKNADIEKPPIDGIYPKYDIDRLERFESSVFQQDEEIVVTEKVHGCCHFSTVIETEDGGKTIKEICEERYSGKVKCYDTIEQEFVFSKICGHSIKENNDDWYEIETEDGITLKLTGNHKVWLNDLKCYRSVRDIEIGNVLLKE